MTQQVGTLVSPADSVRRALIHLRLPFSLVLTPLFVWGVYLARPLPIPWGHVLLAYIIIHIPLYGGLHAFNSYYDRDEGPVGALLEPPPVNRTVFFTGLICKAVALIGGLLLDMRFGLLVGIMIMLSVAYSHPLWRWKERPLYAAAWVFAAQGILGVLWGWTAATWTSDHTRALATIWPTGGLNALGVLSVACWTLGFYPLTGVYQIENDSKRDIRTLAVALGVGGCFLFAALVAALGSLGVWIVLLTRGAYAAVGILALYMVGAGYYTWRWYRRFGALTTRENQRQLMRLSYTNGFVFTLLFLALALLPA